MAVIRIFFLGTSSATPTRGRGLPSIVLQRDDELIIMDCGEGMQRRLVSMRLGLNRKTVALITHLHGDHVLGLLGLLQTMSMAQRNLPLTIISPQGLKDWVSCSLKVLNSELSFNIEFKEAKQGVVLRNKEYTIKATSAVHSVESYCYLIEEKMRPGKFYPEKAIALGVPEGRMWSALQHGRSVTVNGKKITPDMVVGPSRLGRKVGYSGDTRPAKRFISFFKDADVLIFDSTFSSLDAKKAIERFHSTSVEAAEIARSANVKLLVLTHFSARYRNVSSLLREARKIFPNTIAAKDGMILRVPYP